MKISKKHALHISTLAAALMGCTNSQPVDLGDDQPPQALGASLVDYAGSWDGYAEAYDFDDGTDRVRIVLDENGDGLLEVGEAPELPPPDPDTGYPPTTEDTDGYVRFMGLVSGFSYPIQGATVEDNRIQLATSTGELHREWCELQEPHLVLDAHPADPPRYSCLPYSSFSGGMLPPFDMRPPGFQCTIGPDFEPVDCGKLQCMDLCTCTETSCAVANDFPDVELDAALEDEGETLEGTLVIGAERIVVRMTRQ